MNPLNHINNIISQIRMGKLKHLSQQQNQIMFLKHCGFGEIELAINMITSGTITDLNYSFTDDVVDYITPINITLQGSYNYIERCRMLQELVKYGANINMPDPDGNTILHNTLKHGTPDSAVALIGLGANVNAKDAQLRTPLHLVASLGDTHYSGDSIKIEKFSEVAELLVSRGADINALDINGYTPLSYCTSYNRKDVTLTQVTYGPEGTTEKILNSDECALICTHYDNMILKLLELRADPTVKILESNGKTHLHLLVARYNWGNEELYHKTMKVLLIGGANIYAVDSDGKMPYQFALDFKAIACLIASDTKLIEKMDINFIKPWGNSTFCLYEELLKAQNITPSSDDDKGLKATFNNAFAAIEGNILQQFYRQISYYDDSMFDFRFNTLEPIHQPDQSANIDSNAQHHNWIDTEELSGALAHLFS